MPTLRKKFVYLKPKNSTSYEYYDQVMFGLQSCEILEDNEKMYLLKPIKSMQTFWLNKSGDDNWEFEK
jgi:hypothetical protein